MQARWAAESATKEELESHFQTLPIDKALALLAQMRANCFTAGEILNRRINDPKRKSCATCGKSEEELASRPGGFKGWRIEYKKYHPEDRTILLVDSLCSDVCIAIYNQKGGGVRGIPDRGMMPADNPKNHPRQVAELHEKAI